MKAGLLRHRIRIESVTNGVDSLGAPTKTWALLAEVQADVASLSGREYFGANRDLGDETWRITIREIPGVHVDGTYRATDVDTGAVFDITAVLESHARGVLTMAAKSGSSHP
jgi:head-tail adaptor